MPMRVSGITKLVSVCVLEYNLNGLFDPIECPNPPLNSALKSFYRQQFMQVLDAVQRGTS